jgi:hypothetical protein
MTWAIEYNPASKEYELRHESDDSVPCLVLSVPGNREADAMHLVTTLNTSRARPSILDMLK